MTFDTATFGKTTIVYRLGRDRFHVFFSENTRNLKKLKEFDDWRNADSAYRNTLECIRRKPWLRWQIVLNDSQIVYDYRPPWYKRFNWWFHK